MRTALRAKNLEITPSLRSYIESKIIDPVGRLMKGFSESELPILDIEISRTTRHHRKGRVYHAEANLQMGKTMIRAEADDEDPRIACDLVKDELEAELKHFKGRKTAMERRGARAAKKELHLAKGARLYRTGRIRNEGN